MTLHEGNFAIVAVKVRRWNAVPNERELEALDHHNSLPIVDCPGRKCIRRSVDHFKPYPRARERFAIQ
ncbi:hypothetical protein BD414DRAFT_294804 [Trametes punicea]|nr:hypothetical protein BD414DRAFT_294804 [Trametes punicea]